ncbi:MAG: NADH-quinone oxidoreductase subunit G, partial [Pseudomonadales bacterium]
MGHEMNRCITCYRCVRFYQDYAGGHDLAAFASRDHVYFGRADDGVLQNEFAGNLVEVCPTGVFTDKPLARHYTRKWDFQSAPSICVGCSLGCNTHVSERYGELRRIHNRYNQAINGYFLCDRGRYGGDFVNSPDRIPYIGIRGETNVFEAVPADEGLTHVARLFEKASTVIGIGSPRASIESNFMLRQLVGKENYYSGVSDRTRTINALALEILETTSAKLVTLKEVETHDAVLILGEDTTNHAPRLALSLRQATRIRSRELADGAQIPEWHDAAVRKIGQKQLSPLVVATPYQDRLDDVARLAIRETPDNIAKLGFEIAASLSAGDEKGQVGEICRILKSARRPLIVTGSSLGNGEILKAAANIATNLASHNQDTGLVVCLDECNSTGVSVLDQNPSGLDGLL